MEAQRVRDDGLDDVPVRAGHPEDVTAAVLLREPPVVFADSANRAGLHRRKSLATGEHRRTGLLLDHRPQRLGEQLGEFAAGPLAVIDFGEPFVDDGLETELLGQRLQGAPAPQQR